MTIAEAEAAADRAYTAWREASERVREAQRVLDGAFNAYTHALQLEILARGGQLVQFIDQYEMALRKLKL